MTYEDRTAPLVRPPVVPQTLLSAYRITKRFGAVTALAEVTFDLKGSEVHALCGENGAGKSTLIKILGGLHPHGSFEGELRIDDKPARLTGPRDAEAAGIAVIHQELALVPEMTVAENVFLGREPKRGPFVDFHEMFRSTKALLDRFALALSPDAVVGTLGIGHQQLVEIARALSKSSRILVLDEPTAALSDREANTLLAIVRGLRAKGVSCIYISHRLEEVRAIADRVTVLRDGHTVATLPRGQATQGELIKQMVGRDIRTLFPRRASPVGECLLDVRELTVAPTRGAAPALRGIGFEVRRGEVFGIGGLMGSGRTELLMHLFGAWGHRVSGTVTFAGEPLHDPPHVAIRRGLALVSEDRKRYGLVLDREIDFNLSLSSLRWVSNGPFVDERRAHERASTIFAMLKIRAPDLAAIVSGLSGGNQQKVVLGKALLADPHVVLLDEPTRGIDVAAKVEVYELINALTAAGKAVVLVSSELPELIGMSDRIAMLFEGSISRVFSRAEATPETLLAAGLGQDVLDSGTRVRAPSGVGGPS